MGNARLFLGALALGWALTMTGCSCSDDPGLSDGGVDGSTGPDDGGTSDAPMGRCGDGEQNPTEACDDGNRTNDDGCSSSCELECGDGILTGAEVCDTAIAAGETGACPSDCDDGDACTADSLSGAGCAVECDHGDITSAESDDGCCPPGADATVDNDCPSVCGNGVLELDETCDTAIAAGDPGACPAVCDDGELCTTDAISMDGTCSAICEFVAITSPVDGDMCCPTGESLATDSDCPAMCGDGVLSSGEGCDTGITSGAGACPTACDDGNVCTTDMLVGAGTCGATCSATAITAPADGDGCCPPGATLATDSDCTATCGDGLVSSGESCDTAITSGAGACPTSCSDGMACTSDALVGAGTCSASCTFTPITSPANGDGCCPSGATIGTDNDCPAVCGDGVVSASAMETCDTAITSGTGRCPTSCTDAMVCTSDVLANAGTCRAACVFIPIIAPTNGDGCCPAGATTCTDNDCTSVCGDGCISGTESCDDGNTVGGDGCSATCTADPRAFRATSMVLIDPRVYAFGFLNVTGTVNNLLSDAITMDGDPAIMPPMSGAPDGYYDFSAVTYFPAYAQTAMTQPMQLVFGDCTTAPTTCGPGTSTPIMSMANYRGSPPACLGFITGTAPGATSGSINQPAPPCFSSNSETIPLNLGGITITLRNAQIAAHYTGSPATTLTTGLIRGFLTTADAMAAIIPPGTTGVGGIDGQPISSLLRSSDRDDLDGDGTDDGWWFYLNFAASNMPYVP